MTSPAEFGRFLAELGDRRERLLRLVDPDDADRSVLLKELTELSEQLIIADEELQVQQEELVAAQQHVRSVAHERDVLLQAAIHPYVVTDQRGVVLYANLAAEQLIRQPAARLTPRPIAVWFEVADRAVIRSLIGRLASGQQSEGQASGNIRRSDHVQVPVQIMVTSTVNATTGQAELQWQLTAEQPATLQLVEQPADSSRELASELASLTAELARCETEVELLGAVLERTRQLVPAADQVSVLLLGRRGTVVTSVGDGQAAPAQPELREDPALIAAAEGSTELVADTADERRWPAFAEQAAAQGIRSSLSVGLLVDGAPLGALTLRAEHPHAFDEAAQFVASTLAVHAGIALGQLRAVQNLRAGMASREIIGQAIGVLVERRRIPSRQAFDLLVHASQHNNVKLREIARIVVETGQDPVQLRLR